MSEKTTAILQQLKQGIETLFTSDKYAEYLRFQSRFHSYSFSNCLLIAMQCPEASHVASYTTWHQQNRFVKKGAKSIKILAPHTYKETDSSGNTVIKTGFHACSVFDISQTGGDEIPSIATRLEGTVDDMRLYDILTDISPVPVDRELVPGEANGYFSPTELRIVIDDGLSELMTIKVLCHEISHAFLHCKDGIAETADRRTREVQAESVAYTVLNYLNLDTSDYSFGYIAGWSKDRTLPELKSSMELIRETSDRIISEIERKLDGQVKLDAAAV